MGNQINFKVQSDRSDRIRTSGPCLLKEGSAPNKSFQLHSIKLPTCFLLIENKTLMLALIVEANHPMSFKFTYFST